MKEKITELFKSYIFDGILLMVLGLLLIVWPGGALNVLCILMGAAVAIMGILKMISFFRRSNSERLPSDLLIGVIMLVLGIALIVKADFFIEFFNVVLAIMLIYGAILMFAQAIMLKDEKGLMFILSLVFSVITLILAVIIFINPVGFASFMTQLRGISLMVEGLAMILVMRSMKSSVV